MPITIANRHARAIQKFALFEKVVDTQISRGDFSLLVFASGHFGQLRRLVFSRRLLGDSVQ
jgi:hypothetical protein